MRLTTLVCEGHSGLKQGAAADDRPVVELFRNCVCGSTLMDLFADRRDTSQQGEARRNQFDALLQSLMQQRGFTYQQARIELLKWLAEEGSRSAEPPASRS